MPANGQLVWSSDHRSLPGGDEQFIFVFDPAIGMTDMDFHPLTEAGWAQMKCPDPATVAKLLVPPRATIEEIGKGVELIRDKAGFQSVEITVTAF